jgi:HEAT repeat protein
VTQGGGVSGPDLTVWSFWWELNKHAYLSLKAHIHGGGAETGLARFWTGRGTRPEVRESLAPTPGQIRDKVVPALLSALETETNNDIITGAMIALAKIGDVNTESGDSEFEEVIEQFLSDGNQEISETAAVSLGILASDRSIGTLQALLEDSDEARKDLVESSEVDYRTRAFAAYGLGLIGSRTASAENKQEIVRILVRTIESDDTSSRDLQVACIVALGLVPIEVMEVPPVEGEEELVQPPHFSRVAQLDYLLRFLQDDTRHFLVRAHCPTALARLLTGMQPEPYSAWREKIVLDLLGRMEKRSKEKNEVVQGAVLAMGLIGTNGAESAAIRAALAEVPGEISDQQARNFSMIAMAKAGGSPGDGDVDAGIDQAGGFLLDHLSKGRASVRPWAGLAMGVMARRLQDAGLTHPKVVAMGEALRVTLAEEKDKSKLGAYAIAAGIMADREASEILLRHLEKVQDAEARGYVAVSLGLMDERSAIEPIQRIVRDSKYRPELLRQTAIALGLLGDKELVPTLVEMLQNAKGLATQAALASALGFIGERNSIDPLVAMLQNEELTDRARGFAAVALGTVADREPLPWNSVIGADLNYRAATTTLVDSTNGTGILDIL